MAYSMFECPKLHNARSLKFYPDEYEHHIPFRHKNLPPDYELTVENHHMRHAKHQDPGNFSLHVQNSSHRKCPIYVHNFGRVPHDEGDVCLKTNKIKNKQKSVIDKLEETYWANWKPDKNGTKNSPLAPVVKGSKSPEIEIIKSAPTKRKKIKVIKVYPESDEDIPKKESQVRRKDVVKTVSSKSQEIQTDYIPEKPLSEQIKKAIAEEKEEEVVQKENEKEPEKENEKVEVPEAIPTEDVVISNRFLKHTDSFILNMKKQNEEKEHFDQPKCIRLYKKPSRNSSKNYVKGGSYPLKSCLKKDSSLNKPRSKFGRPGSPMIVSSSFSTKTKSGKSHRH